MKNSEENNMDTAVITVLGFLTDHKDVKARKVLTEPKGKAIWPAEDKDGKATNFVRIRFVYGAYNANGKAKNDSGIVTSYVFNERVKYTDLDGKEVKDIISVEVDGFLDQAQKATRNHRHYNEFYVEVENLPNVGDVITVPKNKLRSKKQKEAYAEKQSAANLVKSLFS